MDDILKSPGKVVIKQYSAPKSRIRQAPPAPSAPVIPVQAPARTEPSPPSSTPSPNPPLQILVRPMPIERASSRDHPPSPIGPRPQRPRPTSSPVGDTRLTGSSHHRASDPRRETRSSIRPMSSDSVDTSRAMEVSEMLAGLPQQMQSPHVYRRASTIKSGSGRASLGASSGQRSRAESASAYIHAPRPRPATQPQILPMITAPRVQDAELQRTFDEYANMVNTQALTWNTTRAQMSSAPRAAQPTTQADLDRPRRPTVDVFPASERHEPSGHRSEGKVSNDKENIEQDQVSKKYPHTASTAAQGGLGFGTSVPLPNAPLSKEMANVMYLHGPEKKDKKHRCE